MPAIDVEFARLADQDDFPSLKLDSLQRLDSAKVAQQKGGGDTVISQDINTLDTPESRARQIASQLPLEEQASRILLTISWSLLPLPLCQSPVRWCPSVEEPRSLPWFFTWEKRFVRLDARHTFRAYCICVCAMHRPSGTINMLANQLKYESTFGLIGAWSLIFCTNRSFQKIRGLTLAS